MASVQDNRTALRRLTIEDNRTALKRPTAKAPGLDRFKTLGTQLESESGSNWGVTLYGYASWDKQNKDLSFEGQTYTLELYTIQPEFLALLKLRKMNDHSAKIVIDKDPNSLL